MAKSESAYELSDAEKRDLTELIEQGRPLPEKYRFLLFTDKREVELVWNGKSREVCTAILAFQTLEPDNPLDQSTELCRRLREHSRSTGVVSGLSPKDFMCRFVIFEDAGSDMIGTIEAAMN